MRVCNEGCVTSQRVLLQRSATRSVTNVRRGSVTDPSICFQRSRLGGGWFPSCFTRRAQQCDLYSCHRNSAQQPALKFWHRPSLNNSHTFIRHNSAGQTCILYFWFRFWGCCSCPEGASAGWPSQFGRNLELRLCQLGFQLAKPTACLPTRQTQDKLKRNLAPKQCRKP